MKRSVLFVRVCALVSIVSNLGKASDAKHKELWDWLEGFGDGVVLGSEEAIDSFLRVRQRFMDAR